MTLRSWIVRTALWFLDFLLRERTPRNIALGVAVGIGLGTFPPSTLQWYLCGVAALMLPLPLLIVIGVAIPFSLVTPLADPVFHVLGKSLLGISWLRRGWTFLYHLPILPYLRFNNTVMLGATVFGCLFAAAIAGGCYFLLHTQWRLLGGHFRASPMLSSLERTAFGLRYLKAEIRSHWIRWQSLGLLALIAIVAVPLLIQTFPPWLHHRVEQELTVLHGAPVHIASVEINPWAPALDIRGLNLLRSDGKHILVSLKHLHLQLAWRPLFSRKILITDFTPEGLRLGTNAGSRPEGDYDSAGFVEDRTSLPNLLAGSLHKKLHENYGVSPLRAVGELGNGMELSRRVLPLIPKLDLTQEIQKNAEPVEKEIVHWEERSQALQERFPIAEFEREWAEAKAMPESREAFFKKTEQALESLKKVEADFRSDVEKQQTIVQALRDKLPQTIGIVKHNLHLPDLDGKDATPAVFGPHVIHFIERLCHWIDRSRRIMPTGGARQTEQARTRGYSIHFGGPGQPPLLLLTRAELNSGTEGDQQGHVKGYIANLTSDPYILGRPMELELAFEFPSQDWKGGTVKAWIDHTGDVAKEKMRITLSDFSLANWEISSNQPVAVTVKSGRANLAIDLAFVQDTVEGSGTMEIFDFTPDIYTLDREIRSELQTSLERTRQFTLKGKLTGTLDDPKFELESEWGAQLQEALRQSYHTPLAALDDAIRQIILDEVDPALKKQETQISQASRQFFQRVNILTHSLTDIRDRAVLPDRSLASRKKKK